MNLYIDNNLEELSEIKRLNYFVNNQGKDVVSIVKAKDSNLPLISTELISPKKFEIKINFSKWQKLQDNQRDLLFLHELGRIQRKSISKSNGDLSVMAIGTCIALMEVSQHNVITLAASLSAVSLAGFHLYQRKWGENSMREVCTADRQAIYLATKHGYSLEKASSSLYNALQMLSQSSSKFAKNKYQVRLRALEISSNSENLEFSW